MPRIKFFERASRSVIKSISFRIIVIIADTVIIFSLTHKVELAIGIIIASNLASTILYYLHERLWNRIHWGKTKRSVPEIKLKLKNNPANH